MNGHLLDAVIPNRHNRPYVKQINKNRFTYG